jgi:hypothetical protein
MYTASVASQFLHKPTCSCHSSSHKKTQENPNTTTKALKPQKIFTPTRTRTKTISTTTLPPPPPPQPHKQHHHQNLHHYNHHKNNNYKLFTTTTTTTTTTTKSSPPPQQQLLQYFE